MHVIRAGVELLKFGKDPNDSEWYLAELAINGTLATSFSVPTPVVREYLRAPDGEKQLHEYLERQANMLIERYGDARNPRPDPSLVS